MPKKEKKAPESRSDIEKKIDSLASRHGSPLTSFERVEIARHPNRPKALDFILNITDEFIELFGDRTFSNDAAIVGGFARMGDQRMMIVGQEKGSDTESRLHRNFGMVHPEGFRKAYRLAKLAEKFHLPVVFLVDTPGAYPGITAEERGQGWAIAHNLRELFRIETPIIVLIIGEGCSGGALGMGIGDVIAMLEHAYFSVISPESCASILWRDPSKKHEASKALRLHAEDMLSLEIIDEVIAEEGGAHLNSAPAFFNVRHFILKKLEMLSRLSVENLLDKRYNKFRKMGSHVLSQSIPA